ncbi:MAG: hypothetical protein QOF56_1305 [Acidobacteriaceae bacterium]|nr:hypothetical protein [Acidobacteriaceae bacterium]
MWKAGDKSAEATSNIRALMTNQKTPKVRMVSGKVMIFSNTPKVAFTNPMTSAAIRAAPTPET